MLLLGIDIGTSSIKVSVMHAGTRKVLASVTHPETEREITVLKPGWAEQSPEQWWDDVQIALLKANATKKYDPKDIAAIGITYQMHGLVCVNKEQQVLRDAIIWCDSRAVETGNRAFEKIGKEKCLSHLLNSPGNFTAAKLAWVKENERGVYDQIDKIMLPGDFIAMKLTGNITTSISALSEGIFWDFKNNELSVDVMNYFGFSNSFIPVCKNVFEEQGRLTKQVAAALNLKTGIPVSYKAGDQPNNALSLNVLQPGEVAATAGTSGVIYAVNDTLGFDPQSRVNSFAHVNHTKQNTSIGTLLCINGAGFSYSYTQKRYAAGKTYACMNEEAALIDPGSNGLFILPFGNGAERMLNNKTIGFLDFNYHEVVHSPAHIFRAVQEGIAFAFRYGLEIMKAQGLKPVVIRAGKANMFLSDVFTESFVNALDIPVELYDNDGSAGAAIGAGIGAGIYSSYADAFSECKPAGKLEPTKAGLYDELYGKWKSILLKQQNQ
jgi:xylulokinase